MFFLMQFLGYLTPMNYVKKCDEDPAQPVFYYSYAGAIFVLAMLDFWAFFFHPLQKDIFLDQEMPEKLTKPLWEKTVESLSVGGRVNSMNMNYAETNKLLDPCYYETKEIFQERRMSVVVS